eukprot:NODE_1999_length_1310_cov_36.535080_g1902_i0.p1 GENE.NODE_1999_length_1310_cov_36.535080_g1902_i0~~NODE_1999_length_1310_cov_36.535080_g1902_i0.p1  ORF type:complete len:408 (-),score=114.42 NODE_1999_length_1310_cov_36.535080_g1902_i0:61-1284(-)
MGLCESSDPSTKYLACFEALYRLDTDGALQALSTLPKPSPFRNQLDAFCVRLIELKPYLPDSLFHAKTTNSNSEDNFESQHTGNTNTLDTLGTLGTLDTLGTLGTGTLQTVSPSEKNQVPKPNFKTGLSHTSITMLCIHLAGFADYVVENYQRPKMVEDMLVEWVDSVIQIVKHHRGVVDRFIDARMYISWNAASTTLSHATSAAQCALDLMEMSKRLPFEPYISIVSDVMILGHSGNSHWKQFFCLGPAHTLLTQLLLVARRENVSVLTTSLVMTNLKYHFQFRPVELVCFRCKKDSVWELVGERPPTNNEWMYQIAQQEQNDNLKLFKQAFQQYSLGHYSKAKQLLTQFQESAPNDPNVDRLMQDIEYSSQAGETQPLGRNLTPYIHPLGKEEEEGQQNDNLQTM